MGTVAGGGAASRIPVDAGAAQRPPAPAPTRSDSLEGGWTALPPAPMTVPERWAGVWTGDGPGDGPGELIVFGGGHGEAAAFDPVTRRWRVLPPAPLRWRATFRAVWTGREVIVVAGDRRSGLHGAAYDLTADAWRVLP